MKVEEVPQDLKYFNRGLVRDQNYALDSEGKYQKVWSDGWEPKNDALDVALEDDKAKYIIKILTKHAGYHIGFDELKSEAFITV